MIKRLLLVSTFLTLLSGCVSSETQNMPEDTQQQKIEKQEKIDNEIYDSSIDTATQMMMTTIILG